MSRANQITEKIVGRNWRKLKLSDKVSRAFRDPVSLNKERMICLKDSYKSSVWSLELIGKNKTYPVILKIFKPVKRQESLVELNMYRKALKVFQDLLPDVYFIERRIDDGQSWLCMEYVRPIKDQGNFTPLQFINIIPSLAELHARTTDKRFAPHKDIFSDWLPMYQSSPYQKEIRDINEKTKAVLEEAMKREDLKQLLRPLYTKLERVLSNGPIYFPEIIETEQCIVHSDLQTANMGCHDVQSKQWKVKFMDWEGGKYAPCWYDVVNMVGIFFAYRREWGKHEHEITSKCVHLYAQEMKKRGIEFKQDPYELYKKAYLQVVLEKSLYHQLSWEVYGIKRGLLLPIFLERIQQWGKELKLFS